MRRPWSRGLPLSLAVIALALASPMAAQQTVERSEFLAEDEDDPTEFLADLGFVRTSGNNDVTTLTFKEEYRYDPAGAWAFGQRASWLYGKQDGESNANTITFGLRADRELGPRLAAYATAGYYRAPFGGVSRRFDEGVGLAWKAITAPRDSLGIEAGVSFIQERTTEGETDNYTAGRLAGRYRHMLTDRAYAGAEVTFLPNLADLGDHLLDTEVYLAAPLAAGLALRVSYLVRYDSDPPPGFDTTDTTFTTGIQIQL